MRRIVKWLFVLILLLAGGIWFGVPALLGTDWAKEEIRSAIEAKTGRKTTVGSVAFSWLDGLAVEDVVVEQRDSREQGAEGPLFSLRELAIDVSLRDLVDRRIEVETLAVEAPRIVLIRDATGRFNISDLLGGDEPSGGPAPTPAPTPAPSPKPEPPSGPTGGGSPPEIVATLSLRDGDLLFVDEKLNSRIQASDMDATVEWRNGRVDIDMTFRLNGGDSRLIASADLTANPPPFTVQEFTVDGAALSAEMSPLGMFMPLMGEKPQQATGELRFSIKDLNGAGFDRASLAKTLSAHGDLRLAGGAFASGPVAQIYGAIKSLGAGDLSALASGADGAALAFELVRSTFKVEDGRVHTRDLVLDGPGMQLALSGSTGLDGSLDFKIEGTGLEGLLASNPTLKEVLGEQPMLPLTLTGTLASPTVGVDAGDAIGSALQKRLQSALGKKLPGALQGKLPGGLGEKLQGGLGGLLGGNRDKRKKKN